MELGSCPGAFAQKGHVPVLCGGRGQAETMGGHLRRQVSAGGGGVFRGLFFEGGGRMCLEVFGDGCVLEVSREVLGVQARSRANMVLGCLARAFIHRARFVNSRYPYL